MRSIVGGTSTRELPRRACFRKSGAKHLLRLLLVAGRRDLSLRRARCEECACPTGGLDFGVSVQARPLRRRGARTRCAALPAALLERAAPGDGLSSAVSHAPRRCAHARLRDRPADGSTRRAVRPGAARARGVSRRWPAHRHRRPIARSLVAPPRVHVSAVHPSRADVLDAVAGLPRAQRADAFPFYRDPGEELVVSQVGSDDDVLASFQAVARREIRRAEQAGFRIDRSGDAESFKRVWPLFERLATRKGSTIARSAAISSCCAKPGRTPAPTCSRRTGTTSPSKRS